MTSDFQSQISDALGRDVPDQPVAEHVGAGALPSYFDVAGLAAASVGAAGQELAGLLGATRVQIDRRLSQFWFGMTLRPDGWQLPNPWDDIAGDYLAADGWIKLHTNAPHHRNAALGILGCDANKAAVAEAVAGWNANALEQSIVGASGCAAALRTRADWAVHPQGRAVAQEPLIAWGEAGETAPVARSDLSGVRVLDLTRVLAGPVATRFLAGFGADVLRIDPPGWSEPGVEPEVTVGKRRAGLDLSVKADRHVFEGLLRDADVLVHGYRPDALEGLGYDGTTRRAISPGMIDVSLCAYGWTGSWAARRGFDSLVQMSSGIAAESMRRGDTDGPKPLPVQALDHATGYLMAAAVLRALRVKQSTGLVRSARLSLARTAALLVSGGAQTPLDTLAAETVDDVTSSIEHTTWGPARRLAFPVRVDGKLPVWRYPAGELRKNKPEWIIA